MDRSDDLQIRPYEAFLTGVTDMNRKTTKIISAIIVALIVISMVLSMVIQFI